MPGPTSFLKTVFVQLKPEEKQKNMKKWEGTKITYELPNWVCLEAFIKSQIQTCAFGKGKIPDPNDQFQGNAQLANSMVRC